MTNCEYNVAQELGEMLDDAEDANVELTKENNELKDLLIDALLELGVYKDAYIAELEDVIDEYEEGAFEDDKFCDCPMCH